MIVKQAKVLCLLIALFVGATLRVEAQNPFSVARTSVYLEVGAGGGFEILGDTKGWSIQWSKNGVNLAGQNGATLVFNNVTTIDQATYRYTISQSLESYSENVTLTVVVPSSISLMARWALDGNGIDSSGRSHHATLVTGIAGTADRYGNLNKAMDFDGKGYMMFADSADFDMGIGDFTLTYWLKQSSASAVGSADLMTILSQSSGPGTADKWYFRGDQGARLYIDGQFASALSGTPLTATNEWVHYVIRRTGSTWYSYRNGALVQSRFNGSTFAVPNPTGSVLMGALDGGDVHLDGFLDDVRFYRRGLLQSEILAIAQSDSAEWLNITQAPTGTGLYAIGSPIELTVAATGQTPIRYQWYRGSTLLSGETGSTLNLNAIASAQAGSYTVIVSNSVMTLTSSPVTLSVHTSMSLVTNSLVLPTGATGVLEAQGTLTGYSFQWYRGTSPMANETNRYLVLKNVTTADSTNFMLKATLAAQVVLLPANVDVITTLGNSLVADWPMDGKLIDNTRRHTGEGHKVINVPDQTGAPTRAFSFDGVTSYIDVDNHSDFNFGSGDFTISYWTKLSPSTSISSLMIGKPVTGGVGWKLVAKPNLVVQGSSSTVTVLDGTTQPPLDEWFHIAVVRDSIFRLYINGELFRFTIFNDPMPNPNTPLYIGGFASSSFFRGEMNNMRIYRRALSPTELRAQITAETPEWLAITSQPSGGGKFLVGSPFSLSIATQGVQPITYTWKKNGVPIEGANAATYNISQAAYNQNGIYSCTVSNAYGQITSATTEVEVYWKPGFTSLTTTPVTTVQGSFGPVAWGDFDEDGDLDLFAQNTINGQRVLIENRGVSGFLNRIGIFAQAASAERGAAWADYNHDERLDLVTVGNATGPNSVWRQTGPAVFSSTTLAGPPATGPSYSASWADFNRDGTLDILVANGAGSAVGSFLYKNVGGVFERRSESEMWGPGLPVGETRAFCWADFNNDGYPDFVRTGDATWVFRNTGLGGFVRTNDIAGSVAQLSHGAVCGDFNNDGFIDLFVAGATGPQYFRSFGGNLGPWNAGGLTTDAPIVNDCAAADLDNDGDLDLILGTRANGGVLAYLNNGLGLFEKDTTQFTQVTSSLNPKFVTAVDYNNDGMMDVLVSEPTADAFTGPRYFLRNNGPIGKWFKVRLRGRASSWTGVGAKVRLTTVIGGASKTQMREIASGSGFGNDNGPIVHFGIGDATNVASLRIEWPSGEVNEMTNVALNQMITVEELPAGYPIVRVNGAYSPTDYHGMVNAQPVQVSIYSSNPNIYFSTNGFADSSSTLYTGPFMVQPPVTVHAATATAIGVEGPFAQPVVITVIPTYTLSNNTLGGGSISLNPPGGSYLSNSLVTATATAEPGWTFLRWELNGTNVSTQSPYSFRVNSASGIRAVFGTKVEVISGVAGGAVFKSPVQALYEYGSAVTISATPPSDRYFFRWLVDGAPLSTESPYTFAVTTPDKTNTATFNFLNSNRSLAILYDGLGTVSRNPGGSYSYAPNSTVQLTATAADGSQFISWSNDPLIASPVQSVLMDANKVITAKFGRRPQIQITNPLPDALLAANVSKLIEAQASVDDSTIQSIQFFANGQPIAPAGGTTSVTWPAGTPLGTYELTAVVVSARGASATSAPVNVVIGTAASFQVPLESQILAVNEKAGWNPLISGTIPIYTEWRRGNPETNFYSSIWSAGVHLGRARAEIEGTYRVYLSNSLGSVTSDPFTLTVVQPGFGLPGMQFPAGLREAGAGVSVAYDGTAYIATHTNLLARNRDGSTKWSFPADLRMAPAVGPDGTVYVVDSWSKLTALNPDTGLEKWQQSIGLFNFGGALIGSDGTIYFVSGNRLFAYPAGGGPFKWFNTFGQIGEVATNSASIGTNGVIYCIDTSENLHAINPDGTKNFDRPLGSEPRGQPVPVGDNGVLVGSATQGLRVFELNTGSQRWSLPTALCNFTPVVGPGGVIYSGAGNKVYAVNPTGTLKWERTVTGEVGASAAVGANGYVYFIVLHASGNHLRIFDSNGGSVATNPLPNWASFDSPTLTADSLLYLSSPQGVVPFVAHSAPADSLWPMHRKSPSAHGNAAGLQGDLKWRWLADDSVTSSSVVDPNGKVWIVANNQLVSFNTNGIATQGPAAINNGVTAIRLPNGTFAGVLETSYSPSPLESTFFVSNPAETEPIFSQVVAGHVPDVAQLAINAEGKVFFATLLDNPSVTKLYSWTQAEGVVEITTLPATEAEAPTLLSDGVLMSAGRWLYKVSYSGELLKTYDVQMENDLDAAIAGGPAVGAQGEIFIPTFSGNLHALAPDLTRRWVSDLGFNIYMPPVIGPDGAVYIKAVGQPNGSPQASYLHALNPANGQPKWANPIFLYGDYDYSGPVVTQDKTIYAVGGQTLYGIRDLGDHGELSWRFLAEDLSVYSSPAVDGAGTIYFGSYGGSVYAIQGSTPAGGPWPMFRGDPARTGYVAPFTLAPSIAITSPLPGAVLYAPANITIQVSASDPNGFVKRVDFYDGAQLLGNSVTPPFNFATTLSAGPHALKAIAIDDDDVQTASSILNLTVNPPAAPVVQLIAPAASDPFQAPTNITLLAQATDADGVITRVEFYALSVGLLGTVNGPTSSNHYSFVWTNPPAGSHTLVARAYDNNLAFTDGTGVSITVAQAAATSFRIGPAYSANENAGTVTVTVFKDGGTAGTVNYTTAPLTAEAGRDFVTAQGSLTFTAVEGSKTLQINLLNDYIVEADKLFEVRLVSSSSGTSISGPSSVAQVTIHDDDAALGNLSLIDFRLSANRPASGGLRVGLVPTAANGAWRFPWEYAWRVSDATATNLDQGFYPIEFRPAAGYLAPPTTTNTVTGGVTNNVNYQYLLGGSPETGSLRVYIENITDISQNGVPFWRFAGEANWRSSGELTAALAPGTYVIEFLDVLPFWITPSPREVLIQPGVSTTLPINYARALPTPAGVALPSQLTYTGIRNGQIRTTDRAPYPMVGQLRSPAGLGTGTAVRDRVVLTAAHVLFDETTTNFVDPSSVMWFQERVAGEYEPRPLYPAGFYVNPNYLTQRTVERQAGAQPGVAGQASQQWDVAALYFNEPVARGGQTGYLLSDSPNNEWLIGFRLKQLVGYPIFDQYRGRMHGIDDDFYNFSYEPGSSNLFFSSQFLSYPGNSGGPLWASFTSEQGFFPAGVYLGSRVYDGVTNSVVRAIDSMVASLINRAQSSAELGLNFAGGGVDRIGGGGFGSLVPSTVIVVIEPASARTAGARWKVVGNSTLYTSGQSLTWPNNAIDLEFTATSGFAAPAPRHLTLAPGSTNTVTVTYNSSVAPRIENLTVISTVDGRKVRFSMNTSAGSKFAIDSTTQLQGAGTVWSALGTNTAPFTNEYLILGDKKFYRARQVP